MTRGSGLFVPFSKREPCTVITGADATAGAIGDGPDVVRDDVKDDVSIDESDDVTADVTVDVIDDVSIDGIDGVGVEASDETTACPGSAPGSSSADAGIFPGKNRSNRHRN